MITAKKDLSFNLSDEMKEIFQYMFPDSKIAQYFSADRKDTKAIINQTSSFIEKELNEVLRNNKFSILIDTSTDKTTQNILIINVTLPSFKTKSVETRVYKVLEMKSSTHDVLRKTVLDVMRKNEINVQNIISFMSDGAVNMSSSENGLFGELKFYIPNLYYIGCFCHKMNLIAINSIELFAQDVIDLIQDISSFFHRSYKRTNQLKEIEEMLEIKYLKVRSFIKIRWFSLIGSVSRVLTLYEALKTTISN